MGVATRVVSYSELDSIRQCKLKHHLGYRERWQSPRVSPGLSLGSLFHEVLQTHYEGLRNGKGADEVLPQLRELFYDMRDGSQTEEQELVQWMFDGYVEFYQLDEAWEIVEVEMRIEDWLPTERGTRSSFRLKGHVDLLVRDNSAGGGLWVVDHKTCRDLPRGKDLDFDDQASIYTWLLKRRGLDIRGVVFNHVRTRKLVRAMTHEERFRRTWTVRTDQELETMALEALDHFREAYKPGPRQGPQKGPQGGSTLPPRTPDPDRCGWRCPFTEPCLAGRKGVDMREMMDSMGYVIDLERH